jgi:hypothetical protein
VGYDASRITQSRSRNAGTIMAVLRDDEPIGVTVHAALAGRHDAAIIELIAIMPAHARHGHGHRAATFVEDTLRASGMRRVYAPAPAIHGIDVYFWIRLGYRPLLRADWPCARDGVAWLARDIDV